MPNSADFLVIGGGIAGLTAACLLSEFGQVAVLCRMDLKTARPYSSTDGMAAVMGQDDSFQIHQDDTLRAGAGYGNPAAVRLMVEGGPKALRFLRSLGLDFQESPLHEPAHSVARTWRSSDFTERDVLEALIRFARKSKSIRLMEGAEGVELIVAGAECRGAFFRQEPSQVAEPFFAKATLLATGGLGQLFARSTSSAGSDGEGLALAANAGLALEDLEFVQFHPITVALPEEGSYLPIPHALRAMGTHITDSAGARFLTQFHPEAELAPSDTLAQAIHLEQAHGQVFLDARHLDQEALRKSFPEFCKLLKKKGLDLSQGKIPISPAAHHSCGGVRVDSKSATLLPGLFAAGEVACASFHGASPLPSNALLEALASARFAAEAMAKQASLDPSPAPVLDLPAPILALEPLPQVKAYAQRIGQILWEHAGVVRSPESLAVAKKALVEIPARDYRIQHRQLVAYKLIEACQARPKSLGSHFMAQSIL